MKTSLNFQKYTQLQTIPKTTKQISFKSSDNDPVKTEFSTKKQPPKHIIIIASIGIATITTVGLIRSKIQLSKIEQNMTKYFKDLGEKTLPEGKNSFSRIINMAEKFFNLSAKDTLTGLYNRRYLYSKIPKIISDTRSKNEDLIVAMIDLDYFKSINTAFEHKGGDEYLKRISAIIKEIFNNKDELIVRYGGEEIVIITKDIKKLQELTEKIRTDKKLLEKKDAFLEIFDNLIAKETDGVNKAQYQKYRDHVKRHDGFTTSIGYTKINDYKDLKPNEYISLADKALETLKKNNNRGMIKLADNNEINEMIQEQARKKLEEEARKIYA